jgi:hypothetical protein
MFLDVSLGFVVIHGGVGGQGKVDALEQGCWYRGGGSIVIAEGKYYDMQ